MKITWHVVTHREWYVTWGMLVLVCGCTTTVYIAPPPCATAYVADAKPLAAVLPGDGAHIYGVVGKIHVHNTCNIWLLPFRPSVDALRERWEREALKRGATHMAGLQVTTRGQFEWCERHVHGLALCVYPHTNGTEQAHVRPTLHDD